MGHGQTCWFVAGRLASCTNPFILCPPPSFRRRVFDFRRSAARCTGKGAEICGLPPDDVETKDGVLTCAELVAYTNDNTMTRLHSESIPGSILVPTAWVAEGFGTAQADHQGITESLTRAYAANGKATQGHRRRGGGWDKGAAYAQQGRAAKRAAVRSSVRNRPQSPFHAVDSRRRQKLKILRVIETHP